MAHQDILALFIIGSVCALSCAVIFWLTTRNEARAEARKRSRAQAALPIFIRKFHAVLNSSKRLERRNVYGNAKALSSQIRSLLDFADVAQPEIYTTLGADAFLEFGSVYRVASDWLHRIEDEFDIFEQEPTPGAEEDFHRGLLRARTEAEIQFRLLNASRSDAPPTNDAPQSSPPSLTPVR